MKRPRIRATLAVLLVFLGLMVFNRVMSMTALYRWQGRYLRWNFIGHSLFILIPLACMAALKERKKVYGLSLTNWRLDLKLGVIVAALVLTVPIVAEVLFGELRLKYADPARIISTIVFQVVFSGFGEELLFRGFFQGELNRVYPRRFRIGGTRFGFSLLIVSLLFGIGHLLNPFNPLGGAYRLDWWALLGTTGIGLVFGLVRERTGGLIAVTMAHAAFDVFPSLFKSTTVGSWGISSSLFLGCAILCWAVFQPKPDAAKPASRVNQ